MSSRMVELERLTIWLLVVTSMTVAAPRPMADTIPPITIMSDRRVCWATP